MSIGQDSKMVMTDEDAENFCNIGTTNSRRWPPSSSDDIVPWYSQHFDIMPNEGISKVESPRGDTTQV